MSGNLSQTGIYMNIAGIFLLWRGVQMNENQIAEYKENTYLQNKTMSMHNTSDDKHCSYFLQA